MTFSKSSQKSISPQVWTVFEYQILRVGDKKEGLIFSESHLQTLAKNYNSTTSKYYSLIHRGVRFSHYVGVIQVGKLCIEILPKADRYGSQNHQLWEGILLDLLRYCKLIPVETISSAWLKLREHSILDLYFSFFLEEAEKLLRRGLLRTYRREIGANTNWKGRILFARQFTRRPSQQVKVIAEYDSYTFDHILNQILKAALKVVVQMVKTPLLRTKAEQLLHYVQPITDLKIKESHFANLPQRRQTQLYEPILPIARMLLLNYSPDLQRGSHHLLAMLFDMNVLFEEYIYQRLSQLKVKGLTVKRQQRRSFWNRSVLIPDIVLEYHHHRIVLDTKWKVLSKNQPAISDLKQIYLYGTYFGANRGVLLYPQVHGLKDLPATPFHAPEGEKSEEQFCQVHFVELVKDGKLNDHIAQEVIQAVFPSTR